MSGQAWSEHTADWSGLYRDLADAATARGPVLDYDDPSEVPTLTAPTARLTGRTVRLPDALLDRPTVAVDRGYGMTRQIVGGLLALLFPGLGQLVIGDGRRAAWLASWWLGGTLFCWTGIGLGVLLYAHVASLIDGVEILFGDYQIAYVA